MYLFGLRLSMAYTKDTISNAAQSVRDYLIQKNVISTEPPYLTLNSTSEAGNVSCPVVEALGGRLNVISPWEANWGDGIIKILPKGQGHSFEILLPTSTSPKRDVFTVSHELGHLFLHFEYPSETGKWKEFSEGDGFEFKDSVMFRSGVNSSEYEANEFAASFLMPKQKFDEVVTVEEISKNGFDGIADRFGVSFDAVKTRGAFLGNWNW